jgi:hypothetical protein
MKLMILLSMCCIGIFIAVQVIMYAQLERIVRAGSADQQQHMQPLACLPAADELHALQQQQQREANLMHSELEPEDGGAAAASNEVQSLQQQLGQQQQQQLNAPSLVHSELEPEEDEAAAAGDEVQTSKQQQQRRRRQQQQQLNAPSLVHSELEPEEDEAAVSRAAAASCYAPTPATVGSAAAACGARAAADVAPAAALAQQQQQQQHVHQYSIVYHETYRVPVLYVRAHQLGKLGRVFRCCWAPSNSRCLKDHTVQCVVSLLAKLIHNLIAQCACIAPHAAV